MNIVQCTHVYIHTYNLHRWRQGAELEIGRWVFTTFTDGSSAPSADWTNAAGKRQLTWPGACRLCKPAPPPSQNTLGPSVEWRWRYGDHGSIFLTSDPIKSGFNNVAPMHYLHLEETKAAIPPFTVQETSQRIHGCRMTHIFIIPIYRMPGISKSVSWRAVV